MRLIEELVTAAALLLILGVAINRACTGTKCTSDRCSFKGVATLVTNDRTGCRSEETAGYRAALGVRTGGFCAVGKGEGTETGNDN